MSEGLASGSGKTVSGSGKTVSGTCERIGFTDFSTTHFQYFTLLITGPNSISSHVPGTFFRAAWLIHLSRRATLALRQPPGLLDLLAIYVSNTGDKDKLPRKALQADKLSLAAVNRGRGCRSLKFLPPTSMLQREFGGGTLIARIGSCSTDCKLRGSS